MFEYMITLFDKSKYKKEAKDIAKIALGKLFDEKGRALHHEGFYKGEELMAFVEYSDIATIPMSDKKYKFEFPSGTVIEGDILKVFNQMVWFFADIEYTGGEAIILPIEKIEEVD